MDLTKSISDLLAVHDCVIIPGFGGFIGNYSPARIDPIHHIFSPPFKKLLFNINLNQNDGLLANHLSFSEGISYTDACRRIDEMVKSYHYDLKSGKPFIIPEVGKITMGREGNIQFEQDKTINLLPDSYGLSTFISPPIERNSNKSVPGTVMPTNAKQRSGRRTILPHSLKWAAVFAIPIGLSAMIGVIQYDKFKSGQINDAGILNSIFSRFSSTSLVDKKEAPSASPEIKSLASQDPSVFTIPVDKNLCDGYEVNPDKGLVRETEAIQPSLQGISSGSKYAIIIGAFRVKENALNLVADLTRREIPAAIFDRSRSGLYRVAIATASSRQEAEQLLEHTKTSEFHEAWLLEK